MRVIESLRVALRDWINRPTATEAALTARIVAGMEVVDVQADGAHRWVRVPYSTEYIECTCQAVMKDDCACIRAHLAAKSNGAADDAALSSFRVGQMRAAGLGMGPTVDDLTPAEIAGCATHGPMTAEEAQAHAAALEQIVCWYVDSDEIGLKPCHWPVIQAKRKELGRPLDADDLRSIVDAHRGLDGHD